MCLYSGKKSMKKSKIKTRDESQLCRLSYEGGPIMREGGLLWDYLVDWVL
jgi:hypothetical protein